MITIAVWVFTVIQIGFYYWLLLAIFVLTSVILAFRYHEVVKQQRLINLSLPNTNNEKEQEQNNTLHHLNESIENMVRELKQLQQTVEQQNEYIIKQHQRNEKSLRYIFRTQLSMLPTQEAIRQHLDTFVIFRPRNVMSGDFYWFTQEVSPDGRKFLFLSVIDCTGHGISGAILSILGHSLLNEIVRFRNVYETGQILTELEKAMKRSLHQETIERYEGMDLCLCRLEENHDRTSISFSSAKNGLYVKQTDQKTVIMLGNRHSIAGYKRRGSENDFIQHDFNLKKNDMLYLLSDGLVDQQNEYGKRFGSGKLKTIIEAIAHFSVDEQKAIIENELNDFMKDEEQRDDITMLGVKLR